MPYSLVYRIEAVILLEISLPSPCVINFINKEENKEEFRYDLNLVEDIGSKRISSKQSKRSHGQVLQWSCLITIVQNQRLGATKKNESSHTEPLCKLYPNWKGPYIISIATKSGTYMLTLLDGKLLPRPWHITNLHHFYIWHTSWE